MFSLQISQELSWHRYQPWPSVSGLITLQAFFFVSLITTSITAVWYIGIIAVMNPRLLKSLSSAKEACPYWWLQEVSA